MADGDAFPGDAAIVVVASVAAAFMYVVGIA
jgi:hypothetical protein